MAYKPIQNSKLMVKIYANFRARETGLFSFIIE